MNIKNKLEEMCRHAEEDLTRVGNIRFVRIYTKLMIRYGREVGIYGYRHYESKLAGYRAELQRRKYKKDL